MMNLKEMYETIKNAYENIPNNKDPEKINVVLDLSDPSIGARASVNIEGIRFGIDWESGQLRIRPTEEVVSKKYSEGLREKKAVCSSNVIPGYWCPTCLATVKRKSKCCPNCGQIFCK